MTKNSKDDLHVRPVSESEAKQISDRFGQLAIGIQTFFNAIQRQALTNLGIVALYKGKEKNPVSFSSLGNGLGSRLAYQVVANYPALSVRKILTDKTEVPAFTINLATTGVETGLGVSLEVNSSLKTLKLLGIDVTKKDLLAASTRTFLPFFVRNGLAWWAINSNTQDNMTSKIAYGAAAGAISTPFHNVGIKAIENSPGKTWQETWEAISKDIQSQPKSFLRGASFRSASIAATALFLSPQATDYILKKCSEIFDFSNIAEYSNKPSTSPFNPSTQNKTDNEKGRKI
jgi:hypothetical protein